MNKLNRTIFLIIAFMIFFSGCIHEEKVKYTFDDPDIVAYIDGEPMCGFYGLSKNNYIEMKMAMMKAIDSAYGEIISPSKEEIIGESYNDLIIRFQEIAFAEYAKSYLKMSEEEKEMDYYVVLRQYNEAYNHISQNDDLKTAREESFDEMTREIEEMVIYDELHVYIDELSEKYDMSYEEILDKFYKPFLPLWLIDIIVVPSEFVRKKYKGELVEEKEEYYITEITEENCGEILDHLKKSVSFSLDTRKQYVDYIGKTIKKAEIVDRPIT